MPSHELETIESQVIAFLNEKDIVVSPDEISACHPIPTKDKTRPQPIVIRFVNRKTKQRLLCSAKKLKGTSVFINEHLTSKNARIAREARSLVKDKLLNSCWTRNGNVFIKKEERGGTMKVHLIKDAEEAGVLSEGKKLVEATSGNTGIGLAMIGNQKGYPLRTPLSKNRWGNCRKSPRPPKS